MAKDRASIISGNQSALARLAFESTWMSDRLGGYYIGEDLAKTKGNELLICQNGFMEVSNDLIGKMQMNVIKFMTKTFTSWNLISLLLVFQKWWLCLDP